MNKTIIKEQQAISTLDSISSMHGLNGLSTDILFVENELKKNVN
jgi:hypothetical protein